MLYGPMGAFSKGKDGFGLNPYFLENALRLVKMVIVEDDLFGLNPYFFGKCSTAESLIRQ